jgi:hypothetical protein
VSERRHDEPVDLHTIAATVPAAGKAGVGLQVADGGGDRCLVGVPHRGRGGDVTKPVQQAD